MNSRLRRRCSLLYLSTCFLGGGFLCPCYSFIGGSSRTTFVKKCATGGVRDSTTLHLFFAEESTSSDASVKVLPSSGDESSIGDAAAFMIDAFWLNSPQHLMVATVEEGAIDVAVSDASRTTLIATQAQDLTDKYGERMGKRLLDSCLLTAVSEDDAEDILGLVGLEVCLIDKRAEEIVNPDVAESMIKTAVASLGPKQRRQYKDAALEEIVSELLPPHVQAVCCLSNLGVSPTARRQGIANTLCSEAERIAAVEWGFDDMYLKVESANMAARYLYEEKLGYTVVYENKASTAIRVDPTAGSFIETQADTLVLTKNLS